MNLNEENIVQLVLKAKNGDAEAFEQLYSTYYSEVYYTCIKLLKNSSDAEDITQDTFVEVYNSVRALQEPKSFKSWLNRIAVNKSLNYLKRMNRIDFQDDQSISQLIDNENFEVSTEDKVIEEDVKEAIEEIISRMPEEQGRVLFLYYYCGMTTREIAEQYGCPESTIKSRLAYARKFMKKEVGKMEDEGYKFRCIAALPFISSVFLAQRKSISVVPQKSFSALNSNRVTVQQHTVPNNAQHSINNFQTAAKVSTMTK